MFHGLYDEMVQFASEGPLADELSRAKVEYFERTGELFESDPNFERRMASFLEWYVFDRKATTYEGLTPAQLYVMEKTEAADATSRARMEEVSRSVPSLFEFRKIKNDRLHVIDLLTNSRLAVFERREPAGLESGDIIEARLIEFAGEQYFSDVWAVHPRDARRVILKAAKTFRKKDGSYEGRVNLVHEVSRLSNRCERYKHVKPSQIFAELLA